jgi:LacI family transcriptional regulator
VAGVTLTDVARRAGVSQATASRVLNGSARVPGEAVAERVRAAAAELGYVPNAQAQALARQASGLLGLIVHDIADPYFSSIAHGVQRAARDRGVQVLLASTERDPEAESAAVDALVAYRTEALVIAGSRSADTAAESALRRRLRPYVTAGGRVVVVGQALGLGGCVAPRNTEGAHDLAEALITAGHRRFAVLGGPPGLETARQRAEGFAAALAAHRLAPEVVVGGEFTRDGGYAAAEELLPLVRDRRRRRPLCVFAVNDVMAIGATARWRAEGLTVPDDVCIAGFDDIPTLQDHVPALTTVRLPLVDMGEQAARLALDSRHARARRIDVDATVVLRHSTALP